MQPYFISYGTPVQMSRLAEFTEGTLDTADITLLIQDLIEAGSIPYMNEDWYNYAKHYVEVGLCHGGGKAVH